MHGDTGDIHFGSRQSYDHLAERSGRDKTVLFNMPVPLCLASIYLLHPHHDCTQARRVRWQPRLWYHVRSISLSATPVRRLVNLLTPIFYADSSTRFIIFDQYANVVAQHQKEFSQHYPNPG